MTKSEGGLQGAPILWLQNKPKHQIHHHIDSWDDMIGLVFSKCDAGHNGQWRQFHSLGAAVAKALSPLLLILVFL